MAKKGSKEEEKAAAPHRLHVLFVPLASPGHIIPMVDIARVFAEHGVKATVVVTPLNAARFENTIRRAQETGSPIQFHLLRFPCSEAGLPQGCESVDTLPSRTLGVNFGYATAMLHQPFDQLVREQLPDAIVSDICLPWTADTARKYDIPRFVFPGTGCFSLAVDHSIRLNAPHAGIESDTETFLVPGLPAQVYLTKSQLTDQTLPGTHAKELFEKAKKADLGVAGVVVNSFYELEPEYIEHYQNVTGKKVWTLGPVSLCNRDPPEKSDRGNKADIDESQCLEWLDSKEPGSVLYVCFGSLCHLPPSQMLEIGLGLAASNHPFIWVIRTSGATEAAAASFLPAGFESQVEGRGLIVRGWAPQLLIMSHAAVGAFMTHCGWNSVMEAVSAGVPMITWPHFAEQFYNEKLVVEVLKVGVAVGAKAGFAWGEDETINGAIVEKQQIERAIAELMTRKGGEGGISNRAIELGNMARRAMGEGGSSRSNLKLLIEEIGC